MKMRLVVQLLLAVLVPLILTSVTSQALAVSCNELLSDNKWIKKLASSKEQQAAYLTKLNKYVKSDVKNQAKLDTLIVMSFPVLDKISPEKQAKIANFLVRAFELNASSGFASSQHNLATTFNAPPGSTEEKLVKQDQSKFGFWTKTAAAQGEPRAIFNLAMRMATGVPEAGIDKDVETAYILLSILEHKFSELTPESQQQIEDAMPFVAQYKTAITKQLGKDTTEKLLTQVPDYNLAGLAPKK